MSFNIDSHKLNFHPLAVGRWMEGELIYPVSLEISPSGTCNHHCAFCSQDYLGYQKRFLDKDVIIKTLLEMHEHGTKSVVYAGEGEPLLHPDIPVIVQKTKAVGVDVAMSTNAVLLKEEIGEKILPYLTWIRISLNGFDENIYKKVHGSAKGDFDRVLRNLESTVKTKKRLGLDVTIGIQYVLYDENYDLDGIIELVKTLRKIGVDYFSVKPFSKHPLSDKRIKPFDYRNTDTLRESLEAYQTETFSVLVRTNAIQHILSEKKYNRCLGLPFWSYIDSNSDVWPCLSYIGVKGNDLGNISQQTYAQILASEKYQSTLKRLQNIDTTNCRKPCRLEAINEYLYNLKKGSEHQNFI